MRDGNHTVLGKLFVRKPQGSLPDFMIIGAPKSGTTSLFEYLCEHPDVARPTRKEIHYFDEKFARGLPWYRRHFPQVARPQITGEATTAYLFAKDAPARAAALIPNAKLIAVLRDPVRRAISHYWHNKRLGRVRGDFESYFHEALSPNAERETNQARQFINYPVQWGFYKEQIEHWFEHFPRAQFLFLRFEDMASDGAAQTQRVFDFLGLPAAAAIDAAKVFNAGPSYPVEVNDTTRRLAEVYREKNAGLDRLIGPAFSWETVPPPHKAAPQASARPCQTETA
jgi:hypothetical protein